MVVTIATTATAVTRIERYSAKKLGITSDSLLAKRNASRNRRRLLILVNELVRKDQRRNGRSPARFATRLARA
ncbi:hypothetical protein BH18ACT6_BH18ACT6_14400 [soil metagenome]